MGRTDRILNWLLLTVGCACTLAWVVAAVLTSDRGLDLTDEGAYLLSYRWWGDGIRSSSGVHYLYGPLFDGLGHDVSNLRVFRLVSVLGAHLVLAHAAVRWLGLRFRSAPDRLSGLALGSLVLASGGITYGWVPLSPAYNDVSLLGSILLGALLLHSVTASRSGRPIPPLAGIAVGPLLVAMTVAKWPSTVVTVVALGAIAAAALRSPRAQGLLRAAVMALVSTMLSVVLLHLLIAPVPEIATSIVEVTRITSSGSHAPGTLIASYVRSTATVLVLAILPVLLAGALVLGGRAGPSWSRIVTAALAPVAAVSAAAIMAGGIHAGLDEVLDYTTALVACTSCLIWMLGGRSDSAVDARPGPAYHEPRLLVAAALVLIPPMQAVGTNNPLYFVAVNGFACWVVLLVAAVRGAVRSDQLALSASATLVVVALIGWVSVHGLVHDPYRTSTFPAASGTITSQSTGTLRLDADTVLVVQSLRDALGEAAYEGRPYLAYDEMAGVVLLLDGRPVGQAWSSTHDPSRSSAVLRAYCTAHENSWPHGRPVLLFNRSIEDRDLAALDACGLSFAADYRQLDVTGQTGIRAYLPVN